VEALVEQYLLAGNDGRDCKGTSVINKRFIHIGQGVSGGGIFRGLINMFYKCLDGWHDTGAHRNLRTSRKLEPSAPSFTFVRNPYDWYIARFFIECRKHQWRDTFEKWLFERGGTGYSVSANHRYFTEPGVDYIGRFENLKPDLQWILEQVGVIPQFISKSEYSDAFEEAGCTHPARRWIENYEQWSRTLFTPRAKAYVEEEDAGLLEEFGYHFDDHYYCPGGTSPSSHPEVSSPIWEQEKHLAHWVSFGPGPSVVTSKWPYK
jgi:hypothetical protein